MGGAGGDELPEARDVRVGGVDVREIAEQHGTPFMLVDETVVRGRARRIREAFEAAFATEAGANGVDVYYAGKALLTADVARWMRAEGLRIDACSAGELPLTNTSFAPSASRRS